MNQETQPEAGGTSYNAIADKVGLVPNIRGKDNLIQAGVGLLFALIGAGLAGFSPGLFVRSALINALIGGLIGFIAGALLVGFILMFVGLIRKS